MDKDRDRRLAEVARIASAYRSRNRVPREVAHRAVGAWSRSGAPSPPGAANYFGIKKASAPREVLHRHDAGGRGGQARIEQKLQFADYDSLEASCHDYAWLITRGAPYAVCVGEHYQRNRANFLR